MPANILSHSLKYPLIFAAILASCHHATAQSDPFQLISGGQININSGGTINFISGGVTGGTINLGGGGQITNNNSIPGNSGLISSSGGTITLNSSTAISTQGSNLILGSGNVTVMGATPTIQGGTLTLQNSSALLNWNDARIAPVSFANINGSQGIPVASSIATLPANAPYGIIVGNDGNIALYRAGSGAIEPVRTTDSVGTSAIGGQSALSAVSTVPNGAHSRPLQYRTASGKKIAWVAGDLGSDEHGSRDGDLALGEIGIGYNFGPAQLNLALGRTRIEQSAALNGRTQAQGDYLLAEGLIPLDHSLWLTLGAYGHWGEARIRRGYLNLGLPDASIGSPDMHVYGLRARLDWENALTIGQGAFSPYLDLTHNVSNMRAYTERGGGFPARFDARREQADELRIGMHAAYPLSSSARFVSLTEVAHRFQKHTAATTGEVVGMFAFDVPGQSVRQDWLRLGAGIEGALGEGVGSVMLNLTTQGSAPNVWLAMSYQVGF